MIDIHTHILPGIDDGAQDIYDSIEMAALAYENGTRVIVATPHCNIPGLYDNYFGKEYTRLFQYTKKVLRKEVPGITLLAGMEAFTTEAVPRLLTEGKIFPINRTRYVLMEFDFREDPGFADRMLEQVRQVKGIPVVAHAERYEFVQDDPEIVYRWKQSGCEIQVNKGSFMGRFGRHAREAAYALLNHNLVSVIASDAHSPIQRTTCMADAYDELLGGYPREYLDVLFDSNPKRICNGEKTVGFKKIPFREAYGWKEKA
ncbi:MAG TPA: hypothetical protein H9817_00810 [Candidatus Mediterraneibacter stercorigallinarum]|uniref:protein-tyrosine-phosphatase n=1 Tax=Candidatus Mediterraneibacter stercorigallinarum TaxID=2838686 RepID=A0A9D2D8R8_9FIRM|nr:hypothetical protein [Candidatus Mediterraneibacter stercorigallinarum]